MLFPKGRINRPGLWLDNLGLLNTPNCLLMSDEHGDRDGVFARVKYLLSSKIREIQVIKPDFPKHFRLKRR